MLGWGGICSKTALTTRKRNTVPLFNHVSAQTTEQHSLGNEGNIPVLGGDGKFLLGLQSTSAFLGACWSSVRSICVNEVKVYGFLSPVALTYWKIRRRLMIKCRRTSPRHKSSHVTVVVSNVGDLTAKSKQCQYSIMTHSIILHSKVGMEKFF